MQNYQNYEDQVFDSVPEEVIGCNLVRCTIRGCKDSTFSRCNIDECTFDEPTTFDRSNVFYRTDTPLPEGCVLYLSNLINKDEEPENPNEE